MKTALDTNLVRCCTKNDRSPSHGEEVRSRPRSATHGMILHVTLAGAFLKAVNLAVADIIVVISQSLLAHSDLSPALRTGVVLAIQRKRRGQSHVQRLVNNARVKLGVDIESEVRKGVGRVAAQTRNTVIFLGVDRGDREGVFEE